MRNHNQKARDMARSVLPSTQKGTKKIRRTIQGSERARVRGLLQQVQQLSDVDDFDADLGWGARGEIKEMVGGRRAADKVGPLLRWAARKVECDPDLISASPADRDVHFRTLLPRGLIGDHALTHLEPVLRERYLTIRAPERPTRADVHITMVREILARDTTASSIGGSAMTSAVRSRSPSPCLPLGSSMRIIPLDTSCRGARSVSTGPRLPATSKAATTSRRSSLSPATAPGRSLAVSVRRSGPQSEASA